jgi:23S rRNA pseudouridine2605 synthase
MVRLQKALAEAGIASRRASEKLILEGRVEVNGRTITELGTKVDPAHDQVNVDGVPIKKKRKFYLALHKPRGFISSRSDPQGRKKVSDLLPPDWKSLHPVGRLDLDSEGLLFLTNDGEFTLRLTHPRFGVPKKYLVTVQGKVEPPTLQQLTTGLVHRGEKLKADKARLLKSNNSQSMVELELREGKNREVRRLFECLDHEILTLKRVQIGPIKLGELPPGRWRALTPSEVKTLLRPQITSSSKSASNRQH